MTVDALKQKVIDDFCKLILQLEKGKRPEYYFIIEELNLIDIYDYLDNNKKQTLLQVYLNYDKI